MAARHVPLGRVSISGETAFLANNVDGGERHRMHVSTAGCLSTVYLVISPTKQWCCYSLYVL